VIGFPNDHEVFISGSKVAGQSPKLMEQVRSVLRVRRYALRTERTYSDWIRRYVKFHDMKSRADLVDGTRKVEEFLTHLAVAENVAPSTQNQALNALVFLYGQVLETPLEGRIDAVRASRLPRVPVVLTGEEARKVISLVAGVPQLVVKLLYGSGLRQMEALRLRVQDVDFARLQVIVRSGKGGKDRCTTLATSLAPPLQEHLVKVRQQFEADRRNGIAGVWLPFALERKYPNAGKEWGWQWIFPARGVSRDPRAGLMRRHHVDPGTVDKAIRRAAGRAGINKRVTSHTFRHSFATHLLQRGQDIRTIQELLGHQDVSTTMIYTHVLQQGGHGVKSPLDG
jgi:integron integrase